MSFSAEQLDWLNKKFREEFTKYYEQHDLKKLLQEPKWHPWYNLTDEEINEIPFTSVTLYEFARLVERRLREKNSE